MFRINKEAQVKVISALFILVALISGVFAINDTLKKNNISGIEYLSLILDNMINSLNNSYHVEEISEEQLIINEMVKENKNKLNKKTEDYFETVQDIKEKKDYIIKFKQSIDENKLGKVKLEERYNKFKMVKINAEAEDISELLSDPDVKYLELDQEIESLGDSIPYGIEKTNAPLIWDETKGDGVKIAVLDTGVSSHSDLSIIGGTSVISNDYTDNNGHGTAVIGVISALLNDEGLVGVAPEAEIYAVKIMEGSTGDLSDAIAGVEWAIDNNMQVISMSFGMETYSQIFKEVLEEAYDNGILLISASGNNGEENILYPAAYSSVIAVGATDKDNERASFSSYGNELELVASGVDINSTALDNTYSVSSGTSMAAPHVSGVAALIWAYNNSLSNKQIRTKLRNDALDLSSSGKDDYYGYGLIQADLENWDFTMQNESYFYEVFNITNYGTLEEDYLFWLNGTGIIDDVHFDIGLYLIKKYIDDNILEEILNVTENGSFIVLTDYLNFTDNYIYNCSPNCDNDAVVWKNGNLNVEIYEDDQEILAECFDWDNDAWTDDCYGSQSDIDDCKNGNAVFEDWCTEADPQCDSAGSLGKHTLSTSVSKAEEVDSLFCYFRSSDSTYQTNGQAEKYYYVCNKRQYICTSTTQYEDRCITTIGPDKAIYTLTCPSGYYCDYDQDGDNADFGSSGTSKPSSPCRPTAPKCNGTIEVNSEYSDGTPVNGSYVYLNSVSQGTTNVAGQKILSLTDEDCGEDQNVSVYCHNNQSKLCATKKTSIDFNNDDDSLFFDCNLCKTDKNLKIGINDVSLKFSSGDSYTITTIVHTQNVNENNLNVTIKAQSKTTGLIENEDDDIISVSGSKDFNATVTMDLANIDYIHVYADADNKVTDEPADDNYVLVPVVKHKLKANLSVSTGHSLVDSAIKNYLKFYIDDTSQSQADVIVSIGRYTTEVTSYNSNTLNQVGRDWGWKNGKVYVDNKPVEMPYSGLVGSYKPVGSKARIFIYGNRIEGTIAALKEFISARDVFFNKDLYTGMENFQNKKLVILDKYDVSAIGVFDLMHNDENGPYFNDLESQDFADVITDILNDDNFEISIKTVKTINDNTTLRLKHANSDYSADFKDAVVGNQQPVVLAHGIHSDLLTWNDFATDLATDPENAKDAWLIEMYGGPTTECSNCPVYTFNDLRSYYWPSLIAGVQHYSGQNNLSYVGYDLGCTVALESLENYSSGANNIGYYFDTTTGDYNYAEPMDLSSNPIDTFVAVACVGNFTPSSRYTPPENRPIFPEYLKDTNDLNDGLSIDNMYSSHIPGSFYKTSTYFAVFPIDRIPVPFITLPRWVQVITYLPTIIRVSSFPSPPLHSKAISINLYQDIISWINGSVNPEVGKDVSLNNFAIIQSVYQRDEPGEYQYGTDYFVSEDDELIICKNINSNNKYYISFNNIGHFPIWWYEGIANNNKVQKAVKNFLNDNKIDGSNSYQIISTNSTCE